MSKKQKNEEIKVSFPSVDEIETAQRVCCGRCCNQCEAPAEYAWRKRDVDMANLLEKAIENELTEIERETVELYWFESESITDIASQKNINASAVKRTLARAKEKLENALKYAVMYQNELQSESAIPVILGRARVIAAAKKAVGGSTGDRITRLRQSQNLSLKSVSSSVGITEKRLESLENNVVPDGDEILSLSRFFDVSADYILKGESDGN